MAKRIREKTAKIRENADNRPKASVKYVRVSPSKVGIVLDTVRGKAYDDAVGILMAIPNKSAEVAPPSLRLLTAQQLMLKTIKV